MLRRFFLFLAMLSVAACANGARELEKPKEALGDFKLGHLGIVAPNLVKGPVSRDATKEEWIAGVESALEERFSRYSGDKYYHLGVSVEGYVLAQPGVPILLSPKSALILRVTAWDDAAGAKLNEEPEQITVLESFSAETMVGSGLTQSKEEQLRNLSVNAALQIENWMRKMQREQGWFGGTSAAPEPTASPAVESQIAVPSAVLEEVAASTR